MAVVRQPMTCPMCGHNIDFKYNPLTEEQMRSGWCGDQGGDYDWQGHQEVCSSNQRQNRLDSLLGVTQSESVKSAMVSNENLRKWFDDNKDKMNDLFKDIK